MDLLFRFTHEHPVENQDIVTIQQLGVRLFHGLAAAMRLLLGGYAQHSVMIQRDLLETTFLLEFFDLNPDQITPWRNSDTATRQGKYGPIHIRSALDARDGFKEKKRAAQYKLFCEMGSHPTPAGFQLLAPAGRGAHCGPFIDKAQFEAVLSELARLALQTGSAFAQFFNATCVKTIESKIDWLEASSNWFEHFYHHSYDSTELEEMKQMLRALQEHAGG
jgi:hypothetical protein